MDEKDLLIAQLRKENAALRQMIEDLQKQVKNLTEAKELGRLHYNHSLIYYFPNIIYTKFQQLFTDITNNHWHYLKKLVLKSRVF